VKLRDIPAEDRWLGGWIVLLAALGGLLAAINARFHHFSGICYFPRPAVALIPPLVELIAFSYAAKRLSRRTALAVRDYSWFLLLAGAISLFTTGIQFTPFAPIDRRVLNWDAALGIDVGGILDWTFSHPVLWRLMKVSYPALNAEVFLLPLAIAAWGDRGRLRAFLCAVAYSYVLGGAFYYFFPTCGPAGMMTANPHFDSEQRLTALKFYQVHHGLPVESLLGGMVALPSFHAAWAMLLTYAAGPRGRLFWAAAALNALVVLSTVLLAWHFAVDVLASAALVAASLWAAEFTCRRLPARG
jgi:hypothetical protein